MSSTPHREALFAVALHRTIRWASGAFLAFVVFGVVEVALQAVAKAIAEHEWRELSSLWALSPVLAIWPLLFALFFRQQPIWGSSSGLEIGRGRNARCIPWAKVSAPEWAWYSFDAPGSLPVAYVEIEGGNRIFFYANGETFEKLCALRASASPATPGAAGHDTSAAKVERATRPTFPLVFVPVVLALAVVVNVVFAVVGAGHPVLAVGASLLALALVLTLVVRASRSSNG